MFNSDIVHIESIFNKIVGLSNLEKTSAVQDMINNSTDELISYVLDRTYVRDVTDEDFRADVKRVMIDSNYAKEWNKIPPTLPLDVILIACIKILISRNQFNVRLEINKMTQWVRFSNLYAKAVIGV